MITILLNYLMGGFISGNDGQLGICNKFDLTLRKCVTTWQSKEADLEKYGLIDYE